VGWLGNYFHAYSDIHTDELKNQIPQKKIIYK
jgi:hypothetical protein